LVNQEASPNTLSFSSRTTLDLNPQKINETAEKLSGSGVDMYVVAGLGESGGISDHVPDHKIILIDYLAVAAVRVKVPFKDVFLKDALGSVAPDKIIYYYTSLFSDSAECSHPTSDQFCSSQEIGYSHQHFGIYCVVDSEKDIGGCDEFVKNLSFEVK
jgi:hypothetical protein